MTKVVEEVYNEFESVTKEVHVLMKSQEVLELMKIARLERIAGTLYRIEELIGNKETTEE